MNKRIKVLFLHPPLYPINHKIFNELSKYVDLMVISFGKKPGLNKWDIEKENFNYKIVFIEGFTDLKKEAVSYNTQFSFEWFKYLRDFKPDIVISISFWIPSLYGSLLRYYFRYKFLIYTDAIYYTDKNISFFRKILRKFICLNSDGIISASKLTTEYLKNLCPKVKIYESPHVIDVDGWKKDINILPDKKKLRNELDIPLNKIVLLGVGNFIEKKNWESVFFNIKNLDVYFILIGGGKLKDKYFNLAKKLKIEHKVKILDRKLGKELQKYFKASDIFIFPSHYDQFGFVVLEALASDLPVLCSNRSGASTVIKDGFNGYIIDPERKYDFYIKKLSDNLEEMRKNTSLSIRNYSVIRKVKNFLEIFSK